MQRRDSKKLTLLLAVFCHELLLPGTQRQGGLTVGWSLPSSVVPRSQSLVQCQLMVLTWAGTWKTSGE